MGLKMTPSQLEILSRDLNPLFLFPRRDEFSIIRRCLCIDSPETVLTDTDFFSEEERTYAQSVLERRNRRTEF